MDEDQSFVLDKVRQGLESENISQPLTDEDLERLQWGADNYKIIPEEEWNEWSRKTHWALQVAWLQDTENLQNRNQINEWRVKLAAVVKKGLQKSSMELIVLDSLALHFVEKDLLHDLMHVFGYEDLTEHEKELMAFFSGAANFGRSRGSKEPNFQSPIHKGDGMNQQDPFYEAYTRYRRFGYSAFFLTLFVGVGGIVLWKWYALPIAVGLGLLCTYIWTKRFYQDLSKRTGIQDMEFLDHMMMSERKKRKGIKVTLPEDLEDLNVEERKSPEIKN